MNNNIKWNLKEIGKKRVRIELGELSKLPTIEEYKEYIGSLLGIDSLGTEEKLVDGNNSAFIGDALLLRQELKDIAPAKYEEVTFSTPAGDVVVTARNFQEAFKSLEENKENKEDKKDMTKNGEAIKHAVIYELFERE